MRPILRPTIFSEQDAIVLGGGDTNLDCFSTRLMSRCTVEGVRVKKEFYTIQVLKRHCEQSRKDTGRSRYEALSTMPCIIRPKKTPRCRHGVRRRHNRPHDSRDDSKSKKPVLCPLRMTNLDQEIGTGSTGKRRNKDICEKAHEHANHRLRQKSKLRGVQQSSHRTKSHHCNSS